MAICVGFLYVLQWDVFYILAGITSLVGGVIVLLIVEVFGFKVPIPYNWWILLIIGAAIIVMDLLVVRSRWYLPGCIWADR